VNNVLILNRVVTPNRLHAILVGEPRGFDPCASEDETCSHE